MARTSTVLAATALVLAVFPLAGCGAGTSTEAGSQQSASADGQVTSPSPAAPSATSPRVTGPDVEARCDEAQQIIIRRTADFSGTFQAASAAVDQGDLKAARAHFAVLRSGLSAWARDLDRTATQTRTPALAGVLSQYAGSIRAVIKRAPTVAKLDELYTFSETELDISADQFARTC